MSHEVRNKELFYKILDLPKISEDDVQYLGDGKINLSICNLQSFNQFNLSIVPNPVICAFIVKYILPEPGPVSLKIYRLVSLQTTVLYRDLIPLQNGEIQIA